MERETCPGCGRERTPDEPHGLCPACLLKQGFTAGSSEGDPIRRALEEKLAGQYRIVRLLGRGGMGAVYLARDLALDREVAIKVVKTEAGAADLYDRFRREAKTAARLSHPNVVPLHAFGEIQNMPYFVMGYVRGESLAERLRRDGRLDEEDARRIIAEIADALDHAHRQGVVHRDVKPDNVLLDDESGRALLTDFGVAKASGRGETLTHHGGVIGTPHYMSPEQASGRGDIDGRSDLYSLGVMAFAMLTGRVPFEGATAAEILMKHITQEPPAVRSYAPHVSDATAQLVERCLPKDPAKRWTDARSLRLAAGGSETQQLPDALQSVESHGIPSVIVIVALLLIIRLLRAPWPALVLNAGLAIFIYVSLLVRMRMEGFPASQTQRAIWTEPAWWPFWYPRSLRRRGNVWDRLPAPVRHYRWFPLAFVVYFALLFTGTFPNLYRHPEAFVLKILVGFSAILLLWVVLTERVHRFLRRKGLTAPDARRVAMSIPPSRVNFWSRPHIAAILTPASAKASERGDSPHDHLQSILHNGEKLVGPLRPLGAQAAVAARQILESIAQADRQIEELVRSLEPGEEERLASKIEALAAPDAAPLRSLLEKQLEIIRDLGQRVEELKETKNRRVEMLKTLALHVASLHARATSPSETSQLSENVRTLCEEIGRQALALAELRTSTVQPTVPREV